MITRIILFPFNLDHDHKHEHEHEYGQVVCAAAMNKARGTAKIPKTLTVIPRQGPAVWLSLIRAM